MSERDQVLELICRALTIASVETIERALAAAKRYLDRHPDDWQVVAACEPLYLLLWTLDERKTRS
jgi:cytochrome P450